MLFAAAEDNFDHFLFSINPFVTAAAEHYSPVCLFFKTIVGNKCPSLIYLNKYNKIKIIHIYYFYFSKKNKLGTGGFTS